MIQSNCKLGIYSNNKKEYKWQTFSTDLKKKYVGRFKESFPINLDLLYQELNQKNFNINEEIINFENNYCKDRNKTYINPGNNIKWLTKCLSKDEKLEDYRVFLGILYNQSSDQKLGGSPREGDLPPGWSIRKSKTFNKDYYVHEETKTKQWDRPRTIWGKWALYNINTKKITLRSTVNEHYNVPKNRLLSTQESGWFIHQTELSACHLFWKKLYDHLTILLL